MIRLPNTGTYSLELVTAQNGAQVVVCYSDATSNTYAGGIQTTTISSATTTTICSTPAASTVRDVDEINIKNTFAGSHTITVQVDANTTNIPLVTAALLTDESLNYTHGSGWQCKDANGNTKSTALTAMTSAQLAAIVSDETGSGALVFATSPTLVTPALGTPASGDLRNCSLAVAPAIGGTTPNTGAFTTLSATGAITGNQCSITKAVAAGAASIALANTNTTGYARLSAGENLGTGTQYCDFTFFGSTYTPSGIYQPNRAVLENASSGGIYIAAYNAAGDISFGTGASATERVRIHSSGGVSINNTTDPGAGNLSVTGAISGTSIQNTPVGSTTPSTGAFTTLSATGAAAFDSASGSGARFFQNQLQGNYYTDADATFWINYAGYLGGTTRFRTLNIGDGKNNTIASFSSGSAAVTGAISATTSILSSGATSGIGYTTGAGGTVTQGTSRTTGVTINKVSGEITLVSAAGSASIQSFTVTNSAVAATDFPKVIQKSGTDLYEIHVTNVAAGSFQVSFKTTGGTTTEQPVFRFEVTKGISA